MNKRYGISTWSMFFLLVCTLAWTGCVRQSAPVGQAGGEKFEMVLLHSNDTHSYLAGRDKYGNACLKSVDCEGGFARIATVIEQARAKNGNVIALDAGDQFQGTLFYTAGKWRTIADLGTVMPYDAMTLGNHEFDDGCADAADFVRAAAYPVLAANLDAKPGCPLYGVPMKPWIIHEVGGEKVGIIGIANPEVVVLAAACPQTQFIDSVDAVKKAVRELEKQGVKHIVVISHLGLPEDRKLARSVKGVDVIVGGHTHTYLGPDSEGGAYPVVERSPSGQPVLVVTAAFAAQYLGELKVAFDGRGVPVRWEGGAKRLEASIPPNKAVEDKIARHAKELEKFRVVKIGENPLQFADGMDACRKGDCLSGMVVTDAILEATKPYGAEFVLFNGGGLRAPLKRGQVTRGDILSVLPFGNIMVVREYDGQDVLAALEHGVSDEKGFGPRIMQSSGMRYTVDASRPAGSRIVSAEVLDKDGKARPVVKGQSYKVALPSYLAKGGDGYAMLANGKVVTTPDPMDADLVGAYIKEHSPLKMPQTGRINRSTQ